MQQQTWRRRHWQMVTASSASLAVVEEAEAEEAGAGAEVP
jgi:hypothetical protein